MKKKHSITHVGAGIIAIILTVCQSVRSEETEPVDWSGFFFDEGIRKIHENMVTLKQTRIPVIKFDNTPLDEAVKHLEDLCFADRAVRSFTINIGNLPAKLRSVQTSLKKEEVTASQVLRDLAAMIGADCWSTETEILLTPTGIAKEAIPELQNPAKKMMPGTRPDAEETSEPEIEIAARYIVTETPLVPAGPDTSDNGIYTFDSTQDIQNALLSGDYSGGKKDSATLTCRCCATPEEADALLEHCGFDNDRLITFPVASSSPEKPVVMARDDVVFGVEVAPVTDHQKIKLNLQFRETASNGETHLAGKVLEVANEGCAVLCRRRDDNTWLNILVSPKFPAAGMARLPAPDHSLSISRAFTRLNRFLSVGFYR